MSGTASQSYEAAGPACPRGEMLKLLDELAVYSAPGPGVTRLLYTPEWQGVQHFLQERMAGLGLEVRMDQVGNVYGTLAGSQISDKVILTGSHIDTVVNGGRYDGAYGVAAAVTALHYLLETFGPPLRTLTVVSFCEEEGSRFPLTFWGSGNVTGLYHGKECTDCADAEGITLADAMAACGLGGSEGVAAEAAAGLEQSGGSGSEGGGSEEPVAGATVSLGKASGAIIVLCAVILPHMSSCILNRGLFWSGCPGESGSCRPSPDSGGILSRSAGRPIMQGLHRWGSGRMPSPGVRRCCWRWNGPPWRRAIRW